MPFRGLAIWTGSYYELEARWRYPRITDGKHVQLFDDGQTPGVQQLVAKMDQHIESMAKILGQQIAKTKIRWVRGRIFGLRGRSLGAWAICDTSQDPDLQYLDRHEVAHSVITMMCPIDQGMPSLLAEGWAQSNSTDRADCILALYRRHRDGDSPILTDAYEIPKGDAYSVGAPLAWYLLDTFGGDKFHELYGAVKRDRLEADVLRILGVTWQQVERDFWKWLSQQAEIEIEKRNAGGEFQAVSFDRPQDQAKWDRIISELKEKEKRGYPERLAVRSSDGNSDVQMICAPNAISYVWNLSSTQRFERFTPERRDHVLQIQDGSFAFEADSIGKQSTATNTAKMNSVRRWEFFERWSLKGQLRLDFEELQLKNNRFRHRIHSISEGTSVSDPWSINYSTSVTGAEVPKRRVVMKVDPQHQFDLVSLREHEDGKSTDTSIEYVDMSEYRFRKRIVCDNQETTFVEMTSSEIETTKRNIEAAVLGASTKPKTSFLSKLKSGLVSPKALALGWPLMTLIVFGIGWTGQIKIKVRKEH